MQRRLDLGYRTWSGFQDVVARNSGQRRTILDVENGRRDNYADGTLAWVEHAYRWRPGSVAAVLAGGEPEPADGPVDGVAVDDGVVVAFRGLRRERQRQPQQAVVEDLASPVELAILRDSMLVDDDAALLIDLYRRMRRA